MGERPPRANDEIRKALGERLRVLRHAKGLTQEQLADRSGLHLTYIAGIETGRRNPTIISLATLAAALDCTVAELVDGLPLPEKRRTDA